MVAAPEGLSGPYSGATTTATRLHETTEPGRIQNLSTMFHLITDKKDRIVMSDLNIG